ncbi:MAG: acyltransferase [Bacteroidota bacterium]
MDLPNVDPPNVRASSVSQTALIAASAQIDADVTIGHFCVIERDVVIGAGCRIGHHVVVHAGTRIGEGVRIDDHAVLGKQPMRAAASATTGGRTQPPAEIGHGCLIGTGAVLYAGCSVAERVLIADLATVREEVEIGERTIIGRGVAIENRCRIGARCKFETNAYLCAYSTVADDCFFAPGVLTSNDNYLGRDPARFDHFDGVTVERGGRLGVGAVALPGRIVRSEGVVAAAALLTGDAPHAHVVAGVPARPFREVPDTQRLD